MRRPGLEPGMSKDHNFTDCCVTNSAHRRVMPAQPGLQGAHPGVQRFRYSCCSLRMLSPTWFRGKAIGFSNLFYLRQKIMYAPITYKPIKTQVDPKIFQFILTSKVRLPLSSFNLPIEQGIMNFFMEFILIFLLKHLNCERCMPLRAQYCGRDLNPQITAFETAAYAFRLPQQIITISQDF